VPSPLLDRFEVIEAKAASLEEKLFRYANENTIENSDLYGEALVELSELRKALEELSGLLRKWLRSGTG
jgi:hypothetical protein